MAVKSYLPQSVTCAGSERPLWLPNYNTMVATVCDALHNHRQIVMATDGDHMRSNSTATDTVFMQSHLSVHMFRSKKISWISQCAIRACRISWSSQSVSDSESWQRAHACTHLCQDLHPIRLVVARGEVWGKKLPGGGKKWMKTAAGLRLTMKMYKMYACCHLHTRSSLV